MGGGDMSKIKKCPQGQHTWVWNPMRTVVHGHLNYHGAYECACGQTCVKLPKGSRS